jgi:hypothetical protein
VPPRWLQRDRVLGHAGGGGDARAFPI